MSWRPRVSKRSPTGPAAYDCSWLSTGWYGDVKSFLVTVRARVTASADDSIERTAQRGDPAYQRMLKNGVADSLRSAVRELTSESDQYTQQQSR